MVRWFDGVMISGVQGFNGFSPRRSGVNAGSLTCVAGGGNFLMTAIEPVETAGRCWAKDTLAS